jgi:hypothetical protein
MQHIVKEMFAAMANKARTSEKDSVESVLFDWFCFIRITGLRVAEHAQSTQTSVDIHKYPSRKTDIKAFIANDWKFHNKKARLLMHLVLPVCQPRSRLPFKFKSIGGTGSWSLLYPTIITWTYAQS